MSCSPPPAFSPKSAWPCTGMFGSDARSGYWSTINFNRTMQLIPELHRPVLGVEPAPDLAETPVLIEAPRRRVLREYVQRQRPHIAVQRRREQRRSDPLPLMHRIDEELVDMRPLHRQIADGTAVLLRHQRPVPLHQLPVVPVPDLRPRIVPVHEPVGHPAGGDMD